MARVWGGSRGGGRRGEGGETVGAVAAGARGERPEGGEVGDWAARDVAAWGKRMRGASWMR